MQRKHHEAMVKALMHLMRPEQEPRVQAHAASAVVNFCEGLDENSGGNIVGRYIKPLSEHLVVLLQSPSQLVVEGALTATSSIADSAGVCLSFFTSPRPRAHQLCTTHASAWSVLHDMAVPSLLSLGVTGRSEQATSASRSRSWSRATPTGVCW